MPARSHRSCPRTVRGWETALPGFSLTLRQDTIRSSTKIRVGRVHVLGAEREPLRAEKEIARWLPWSTHRCGGPNALSCRGRFGRQDSVVFSSPVRCGFEALPDVHAALLDLRQDRVSILTRLDAHVRQALAVPVNFGV